MIKKNQMLNVKYEFIFYFEIDKTTQSFLVSFLSISEAFCCVTQSSVGSLQLCVICHLKAYMDWKSLKCSRVESLLSLNVPISMTTE